MLLYKVTAQVWETFDGFAGVFDVPVFYVDVAPEGMTGVVCAIVGKDASHVAYVATWMGPDNADTFARVTFTGAIFTCHS